MALPNPSLGSVSRSGKTRSYTPNPNSGHLPNASDKIRNTNLLATLAATTPSKNHHRCAPSPDRDRSTSAGHPSRAAASRTAPASLRHAAPPKSTAANLHKSPSSSGYTPIAKSLPRSSLPTRCILTCPSPSGTKALRPHLPHLFPHTPLTHSFAHTGAYPTLPDLPPTNLRAHTSPRPANRLRNTPIFSSSELRIVPPSRPPQPIP